MEEDLKKELQSAVQSAVSNVSYETGTLNFTGSVKFEVNDGWTKVTIVELETK